MAASGGATCGWPTIPEASDFGLYLGVMDDLFLHLANVSHGRQGTTCSLSYSSAISMNSFAKMRIARMVEPSAATAQKSQSDTP